jgi:hypothetical protein
MLHLLDNASTCWNHKPHRKNSSEVPAALLPLSGDCMTVTVRFWRDENCAILISSLGINREHFEFQML